jgi:hypothetical protein
VETVAELDLKYPKIDAEQKKELKVAREALDSEE